MNAVAQYAESAGYITWDMGGIYTVDVSVKVGMKSSIAWATTGCMLYAAVAGTYYAVNKETGIAQSSSDVNVEIISFTQTARVYGRYLKMSIKNMGAQGNVSICVYRIQAWDVGL